MTSKPLAGRCKRPNPGLRAFEELPSFPVYCVVSDEVFLQLDVMFMGEEEVHSYTNNGTQDTMSLERVLDRVSFKERYPPHPQRAFPPPPPPPLTTVQLSVLCLSDLITGWLAS